LGKDCALVVCSGIISVLLFLRLILIQKKQPRFIAADNGSFFEASEESLDEEIPRRLQAENLWMVWAYGRSYA